MKKVVAVALSCIVFLAFKCSAHGHWQQASHLQALPSHFFLKQPCAKTVLKMQIAMRLTVLPAIVALITSFGFMPLQEIAIEILTGNWKVIFLAAAVAPIVEEIVFRGFLQERLEDVVTLVSRTIYPMSSTEKAWFSTVSQSLLFGAVHIIGGQVATVGAKILVFLQASILGFVLTVIKKERDRFSPRLQCTPLKYRSDFRTLSV